MKKRTYGINREKKQLIAIKKDDGIFERCKIRSKNDAPIWNLFKEYINSIGVGHEFSRKDLLEAIYTPKAAAANR